MRHVKRVVVTVVGVLLLAAGAVMMVLPGPGILGLAAGLAVLATEYAWARRLLGRARVRAEEAQRAAVASPSRTAGSVALAVVLVALGVLMLTVDDPTWPVLDTAIDAVWGPVTGTVLVLSGLVVVTTTAIALRGGRHASAPPGARAPSRVPADPGPLEP